MDPAILDSQHAYKYSLSCIVDGVCVMRYDNERGKGNHKHFCNREFPLKSPRLTT
ncbi:toxin-antitoxin system TumE family protein [Pluralibacter gergoviae]|uniref:toxin-antitoxin system TumE family protein n=1 Tax=Pluralibacter gergoviae TaxID=61647 RepID=UPI000AE34E33|nr:DUF6516 family protein [Pluralibacter gergoviae]MCK1067619.1 DUF6516 family protein [Pluralibacter gergoviae]MCV7757302.1 DUF6516 family protein [Pluralibacter gergoviae]MDU4004901.1 DUF6516 family protein [Pluralibacter gergoviae]